MNDSYVDNAFPQNPFVDILLEIAREDKEFRAYLRGILESVPDDTEAEEASFENDKEA